MKLSDHHKKHIPNVDDIKKYTKCPNCGMSNVRRSILCIKCGADIIKVLPRELVTEKDLIILLHVMIARKIFLYENKIAEGLAYLNQKFGDLYDQIAFEEIGYYHVINGSYDECLYFYEMATHLEPWLSLTKPADFEEKIRLIQSIISSGKTPDDKKMNFLLAPPLLDHRRIKILLENLQGTNYEEQMGFLWSFDANK